MAALLVVVFLGLATLGLRHLSLTFDEPHHWRYGQNVLAGNSSRFDDSKMPVSAVNAMPGKVASWLQPGPLQDRLASPAAARSVTIAAAALLALLTFRWGRELYGVGAGLFALALYAFDPNVIAHSRLITTDLYAALAVTATCYTFWRFCRRPGWPTGMLAAAALAASQVAKYFCILLYPVLAVVALGYWAPTLASLVRAGDIRGLVVATLETAKWVAILALVSLALINAGFLFSGTFTALVDYPFRSELFRGLQAAAPPWLARLPLPLPYPYLEGLDWVVARERTGEGLGPNYLLGHIREGRGFFGYYLVAYLFKVPLAVQIALLAALVLYGRRWRTNRFRERELFLLGPVLLLWIYFNVFDRAQIGLRHIMLTFPLMHIFTASLLESPPVWPRWRRLGVGTLLAWQVISVLSYFPHELAYFNELLLDRRQAYKVLSDSNIDWHQSEWYLARYLEAHPEAIVNPRQPVAGTVVVAVLGVTGVAERWGYRYRWLRHFEPVDHVAHAYLVYRISPDDLARVLREHRDR